jgi:hypothetical protein
MVLEINHALSDSFCGDQHSFMAFPSKVRLTVRVPEDSEEPYALWCVFGDHPPFAASLGGSSFAGDPQIVKFMEPCHKASPKSPQN